MLCMYVLVLFSFIFLLIILLVSLCYYRIELYIRSMYYSAYNIIMKTITALDLIKTELMMDTQHNTT